MISSLNPYFFISIFIFSIHFIATGFINDNYSFTRIIITVSFSLYLLITLFYRDKRIKKKGTFNNLYILFFMYTGLQTYFSLFINTEFEIYQQLYISASFILFISFFLYLRDEEYSLSSYLSFILIISSIYSIFIVFRFVLAELSLYDSIIYYFRNIRFLNHLQTLIIPSLGLALLVSRTELQRIILNISLIVNFMLLFETGARGTFYALSFSYLYLYLRSKNSKHIRNNLLQILFLFISSLVLYIAVYYIFGDANKTNHLLNLSSSGRVEIYKTLLPLIFDKEYFFSAIGFSSQDIALYGFLHPHNIFIYIFLGAGSFGLLLFIVIISKTFFHIYNECSTSNSLIKHYIFTIFLALFIHAQVSGIYISPLTSIVILYFFFILYKYYKKANLKKITSINQRNTIVYLIGLITLVLFLTYQNYMLKKSFVSSELNKGQNYVPGIMLYNIKIFSP